MLTTPLFPSFQGEGRRLVFAAAPIYLTLVNGCIVGGGGASLLGLVSPMVGIELPISSIWWFFTGLAVFGAGLLAAYSLPFIKFDLRERVYSRRDGAGLFGQFRRGRIDAIDAVVVTAKANPFGQGVTYRLMLFWKNQGDAPMILAEDTRSLIPGSPLNAGAGQLLNLGQRVATALQVRLFDNSMVPSA